MVKEFADWFLVSANEAGEHLDTSNLVPVEKKKLVVVSNKHEPGNPYVVTKSNVLPGGIVPIILPPGSLFPPGWLYANKKKELQAYRDNYINSSSAICCHCDAIYFKSTQSQLFGVQGRDIPAFGEVFYCHTCISKIPTHKLISSNYPDSLLRQNAPSFDISKRLADIQGANIIYCSACKKSDTRYNWSITESLSHVEDIPAGSMKYVCPHCRT